MNRTEIVVAACALAIVITQSVCTWLVLETVDDAYRALDTSIEYALPPR